LRRLASCIDRGLDDVKEVQAELRQQVKKIQTVASTLDPANGSQRKRRGQFVKLQRRFSKQRDLVAQHMAKVMASFLGGLFVGPADDVPQDNLDLERWFRLPKGHERRIHGRCHAGVRLVHEGPTLVLTLDAHLHHPEVFTAPDLIPYHSAQPPPSQRVATARRRIMRKARSSKMRPALLAELEQRYRNSFW
jgi:hypothetical protein